MKLQKDNNKKKLEIYVILFIIILFFIIIARYLYYSSSARNIFSDIDYFFIKKNNANYFIKKNNANNTYSKFKLKIDEDKKWLLLNENDKVVDGYEIKNDNGKIAIKKIDKYKNNILDVNIEGINTYFNNSGYLITDIPYDIEKSKYFFSLEQEDLFPIFGYHSVIEDSEEIINPYLEIKKSYFEKQIKYFNEEMNCRWILLGDLVENYILKNEKIPKNSCVINFDDGRKNNYDIAFPILKNNNIIATFYIIFGHLGKKSYMTSSEVSDLFRSGNEIGSHTLTGGGLVNADWFEGIFNDEELYKQVSDSKKYAQDFFYDVKTFAYPLGEWNDNVVSAIKNSGYIAARDTEKDNGWRDQRALSVSMDDDFIWHLNYYKTELHYNEEIKKEVGYNGWWQFEEGNLIVDDKDNDVNLNWGIKTTEHSYAVVSLNDEGDSNENMFILKNEGNYIMDMLISNDQDLNNGFTVFVDDEKYIPVKDDLQECISFNNDLYCHYLIEGILSNGKHKLKIVNKKGNTLIDCFSISQKILNKEEYIVEIME